LLNFYSDDILNFISTHHMPRFRSSRFAAEKLLHVEGATFVTLSGGFADGVYKMFEGLGNVWLNGVGGQLYNHSVYAIAGEVNDKKGKLRVASAVVYMLVAKHGETQQQMGMPADADSSIHLGTGFVGIALDTEAENGKVYTWDSFDTMDKFVAERYA